MRLTPGIVFLIVAIVLFLAAAFVRDPGFDLVALGLASLAAAFLVDRFGDRAVLGR